MIEALDLARRLQETGRINAATVLEEYAKSPDIPYSVRLEEIKQSREWRDAQNDPRLETRETIGVKLFEFARTHAVKIPFLFNGGEQEQMKEGASLDFRVDNDAVITAFRSGTVKVADTAYLPYGFSLIVQDGGSDREIAGKMHPDVKENVVWGAYFIINPLDPEFGRARMVRGRKFDSRIVTDIIPQIESSPRMDRIEHDQRQLAVVLIGKLASAPAFQPQPLQF